MTTIEVGCDLSYEVRRRTIFLFNITAATTSHQTVDEETLTFDPALEVENYQVGLEGNRLQRVIVEPCTMNVTYRATVNLVADIEQAGDVGETPPGQIPADVLTYMNPSRYCESDLLARFAFEEFAEHDRGFCRVQAICDWVYDQLDYTPGSTSATTTSADVLLQRTGVCRDYAHLAISLCRGIGIPARYVSGYAVDLQPPDYHGFFEAFLDGQWFLFDPTRLASTSGLVRIGVGRDAADVAFSTFTGDAILQSKSVWAKSPQLPQPESEPAAVSTA